jgi:signal transduction histidine kinase
MIYIKDYGTGISQENIEILFKTNQQIESNKGTENERSSGLGLTLCRDFIETMGGTLSIESELNNGSKFIFTIPAAD